MLRILKPKLIGGIQGPIPLPAVASDILKEINGIIRLLHGAGLVAGVFDASKMMECDQDQVTHAYRSLYDKLTPLTGECDPTDQAEAAIVEPREDTTPDRRSTRQLNLKSSRMIRSVFSGCL